MLFMLFMQNDRLHLKMTLAVKNTFFNRQAFVMSILLLSAFVSGTLVVVQKDNLYIGIAGEAKENIAGFTSKDNLITGKSKAKGGGAISVEGWKQN